MGSWWRGTQLVRARVQKLAIRSGLCPDDAQFSVNVIPGTAFFLTGDPEDRALGAAAQPQAQPGAARADRAS
jgi:hypothetical protein